MTPYVRPLNTHGLRRAIGADPTQAEEKVWRESQYKDLPHSSNGNILINGLKTWHADNISISYSENFLLETQQVQKQQESFDRLLLQTSR